MIWIYVGLTLLAIIYFFRKLNKNKGFPVLQVKISTDDGFRYKVEFETLNPETTSIEYLRLNLSYITKIYAISDGNEKANRNNLKFFLNEFDSENSIESVLKNFERAITMTQESLNLEAKKTITAVSLFKDIKSRNLYSKLPLKWYPNQLYLSVIALTSATLEHLNDHEKGILSRALKTLYNFYESSDKANSVATASIFANKAFLESTFNI